MEGCGSVKELFNCGWTAGDKKTFDATSSVLQTLSWLLLLGKKWQIKQDILNLSSIRCMQSLSCASTHTPSHMSSHIHHSSHPPNKHAPSIFSVIRLKS